MADGVLTLPTKGNETKQPIIESQSAKSEEKKLRVHKAKKELPLVKTESQPRCQLGLSYWQKKNYKNLVHKNLKKGTWHGFLKEVLKIRIM